MEKPIKYPYAFAIDIDGTLVTSYHPLKGSTETINILQEKGIPYVLLTNNVSKNQQTKADELNEILKPKVPIKKQKIILNTTPLKKFMKLDEKTILLVGRERKLNKMLPMPQIPSYITIEQYCTIFPQAVPLSARHSYQTQQEVEITKQKVKQRLKWQKFDKHSVKFGAILVVNCPNKWQQCYQIIVDLLSSQDGSIPQSKQYKYVENHIPIMTALNDLFFTTQNHNLPRLLLKPFTDGLTSVYKSIYGQQLKVHKFGKPQKKTYQFTQKHIQEIYGPVQKYIMIGDNQQTDILGAYNAGWESILVKTGVTKHNSQYATHNCQEILEGIQKYL